MLLEISCFWKPRLLQAGEGSLSLHPSIDLADLLRNVKAFSSKWIKQNKIFPCFTNWQDGYAAFTLSFDNVNSVIEYIINQEQHHYRKSFLDEYKTLLIQAGIQFDPKYLL
ncbi:transposase [Candidatus Uabimicrobium amorphum]|uniref:transposase n=1 Tax=Uabimicrobium amorphum TaxID=2596890 RepID=UPI00125FDA71